LIEFLVLGVRALTFSGDVAVEDENKNEKKNNDKDAVSKKKGWLASVWLGLTVLFSFGVGLFIFFYVFLILTELLGAESGFMFNLVDGFLRMAIFLLYLGAITLMKDIWRIFEYHGAEHKSIFAFENNKDFTPAVAKLFSRFHSRCGSHQVLL